MRSRPALLGTLAVGVVIVLIVLGVARVMSAKAAREVSFQSAFSEVLANPAGYHFLIFIDVDACLACTEDMAMWVELEKNLPQCGCSFSIYAPASDSFDVAYAMELEGLGCSVLVLSEADLVRLRLTDMRTPIKILLDSLARPINIKGAMGNREESRRYSEQILSDVCRKD